MPVAELQPTASLVPRLLLGALSDDEQRQLTLRLLRSDPGFRRQLAELVPSFARPDLDLAERYAALLARGGAVATGRAALLRQAFVRSPDLGELIRGFTSGILAGPEDTASWTFSWTMAEFLLARVGERELSHYNERTSLYLARLIVDVLDILTACGQPAYPAPVLADLRQRLAAAAPGG